jgi:electron-transferring-flavoprotein dehydrogenase
LLRGASTRTYVRLCKGLRHGSVRRRARGAPVDTPATSDAFFLLSEKRALRLPTPPQQRNEGNFVISLSQLTRWLASQAEELGADILPGFPAASLLHASADAQNNRSGDARGASLPPPVVGVATGDVGIGRDGARTSRYARGAHVRARATLLAEGARGHLSERAISTFRLRQAAGAAHQTYALGIKEVWSVRPDAHSPGTVWHTVGYPLDADTYGGGFLYHLGAPGLVALGLVVALDYTNPYLSPFREFQRWKTHPRVAAVLAGGAPVQYGARTLVEGGLQSLPALAFPGGALLGDAAGTLNVPKIKGSHTAMKSGALAGEAAFDAVLRARLRDGAEQEQQQELADMSAYPEARGSALMCACLCLNARS